MTQVELKVPVKAAKTRATAEFGDFQTPPELARAAVRVLTAHGVRARSILEPTCGTGAFLSAALESFPAAESLIGLDRNPEYISAAARDAHLARRAQLHCADFFKVDWPGMIAQARAPWLILGNPPWVTSSHLGALESTNLPEKSNFQERKGIDAITGKSNFDISEWMLLNYLRWLEGSEGTIAVLCKTAVARKILLQAWKRRVPLAAARMYKIDALKHFGASVNACFFVLEIQAQAQCCTCKVFESLEASSASHTLGYMDGHLISDRDAFNAHRHLLGTDEFYVWRSGVKHDCSQVMELKIAEDGYRNGSGELVAIEDTYLYPMLKSSDVGNGRTRCRSAMVVTQRSVGEDTAPIRVAAPRTWEYLNRHATHLKRRASSIYKNKPPFSIFGVGPYTFAPWKIAISGFYKNLRFVKIGPVNSRPVVLDDTINFLPCRTEDEADFLEELLHSEAAQRFFGAMIHWEEKRPITVDILRRLSIRNLAAMLGRQKDYASFVDRDPKAA